MRDYTKHMGAFLENSLFFFVDDAEPILPIFRSPEYGDPGRIVEVTDVGCDTETTYPIHLPRNGCLRRRGGAESYESTRRVEWDNERPNKFFRTVTTILNNNKVSEFCDREKRGSLFQVSSDRSSTETEIMWEVKRDDSIAMICTSMTWVIRKRIPSTSCPLNYQEMLLIIKTIIIPNSSIPESDILIERNFREIHDIIIQKVRNLFSRKIVVLIGGKIFFHKDGLSKATRGTSTKMLIFDREDCRRANERNAREPRFFREWAKIFIVRRVRFLKLIILKFKNSEKFNNFSYNT